MKQLMCLRCEATEYRVVVTHNPWLVCDDCVKEMNTMVMCGHLTDSGYDYVG